VDGQPESRKTAKIRAGQTVEYRGARILVTAPLLVTDKVPVTPP